MKYLRRNEFCLQFCKFLSDRLLQTEDLLFTTVVFHSEAVGEPNHTKYQFLHNVALNIFVCIIISNVLFASQLPFTRSEQHSVKCIPKCSKFETSCNLLNEKRCPSCNVKESSAKFLDPSVWAAPRAVDYRLCVHGYRYDLRAYKCMLLCYRCLL